MFPKVKFGILYYRIANSEARIKWCVMLIVFTAEIWIAYHIFLWQLKSVLEALVWVLRWPFILQLVMLQVGMEMATHTLSIWGQLLD